MLKLLSAAALLSSSLLAVAAIQPVSAAAQDLELHVGPDGVPRLRSRDDDRPGYREHRYHRGHCDPDEAEDAARDLGLHRPHVVRMGERSVVVEGFRHGERYRVRFANERGCPELR